MNQDPVNSELRLEIFLMGTLDYHQLFQFYQLVNIHKNKEWQVDWYEDIPKLISSRKSQYILSNRLYTKIYELIDLGKLVLEAPSNSSSVGRVVVYIQDGLMPSFQIRTQSTFSSNLSNAFASIWQKVRDLTTELERIARTIKLTPTCYTWLLRIRKHTPDSDRLIDSSASGDSSYPLITEIQTAFTNIDSASRIGEMILIKLVEEEKEQYLIICQDNESEDIVINRLYYLTIAKMRIKQLIQSYSTMYDENIKRIEGQLDRLLNSSLISPKIKISKLNELLLLRHNIVSFSTQFKKFRDQMQLVKNFIQFHCGVFLNMSETRLTHFLRGVIESEKACLELFYTGPLENMANISEAEIRSASDFVEEITDIFEIKVNMHLQTSIRRWTIILAVLSFYLIIFTIFGFHL